MHEPTQSAEMRVTVGKPTDDLFMKLDLVDYKPDSWVKVELGGATANSVPGVQKLNLGKYQHLDQTRIKGNRNLGFDFDKLLDPAGSEVLTQGITEVRQTGEGAYAGTIDVSKAAEAGSVDPTVITALGAQAKSVPFTAKLDPQGRLSEMVIQIPAAGQTEGAGHQDHVLGLRQRHRRAEAPGGPGGRGPGRALQPVQLTPAPARAPARADHAVVRAVAQGVERPVAPTTDSVMRRRWCRGRSRVR